MLNICEYKLNVHLFTRDILGENDVRHQYITILYKRGRACIATCHTCTCIALLQILKCIGAKIPEAKYVS